MTIASLVRLHGAVQHQESAVGFVRRPDAMPPLAPESVTPVAVGIGLKSRSKMGRYAPAFLPAAPDNDTSGGKPALVQYPG